MSRLSSLQGFHQVRSKTAGRMCSQVAIVTAFNGVSEQGLAVKALGFHIGCRSRWNIVEVGVFDPSCFAAFEPACRVSRIVHRWRHTRAYDRSLPGHQNGGGVA